MNPTAKWLIFAGIVLTLIGLLWQVGSKLGLGRLPGDIVVERENVRFYFPIVTSLILSAMLSVGWYLLRRMVR